MTYKRFPLNVPGDFYVINGHCISCEAPEHEAPELMAHWEQGRDYHCYFKRQPENATELEHATLAVVVSCCQAVRYGGQDKSVIESLARYKALDQCDHIPLAQRFQKLWKKLFPAR